MCPQSVARYCKQTLCITSVYQATLSLLGRLCTKVDANKDPRNSQANFSLDAEIADDFPPRREGERETSPRGCETLKAVPKMVSF